MTAFSRSAKSSSFLVGTTLLFSIAASAPRGPSPHPRPRPRPPADVPFASLDLAKMKVQPGGGRGGQQTVAQANKSIDGNPIHIGDKEFTAGVGTRANSVLFIQLNGRAEHFSALVGADPNPIPPPDVRHSPPPAPPPPDPNR